MKLQVTQENLNKALANVSRVAASARGSLPILSNILFKAEKGNLILSATNLEIAVTEVVGAKISKEGTITIPARLLQEYVSSLPSGTINLDVDKHKLHISSGDYKSTINGMIAEDFPVIPKVNGDPVWKINSGVLKKALNQVVFAASSDDARPVLTGVLLHAVDGDIYLAATDSYRLAEKKIGKAKQELSLLIPATALSDLQRILGDEEDEVMVYGDSQQVAFRVGSSELVSRLIEGNYPDYRKLLPTNFEVTAEVDKNELLSAAKLASLFARESAGSVMVTVDPISKSLSIQSAASQLGENSTSLSAKVKGDGDISLNSRFIIEGLQAINEPNVVFSMNGKLDPCVLKGSDSADYLHVIMPLKS